jgi:hypothetical protein
MSHAGSCLGYICTCGQDHSDKNRSWCDRSDLEIENDRLKAENARYREALEIVAEGEAHPLRYYQLRDLAREALKKIE